MVILRNTTGLRLSAFARRGAAQGAAYCGLGLLALLGVPALAAGHGTAALRAHRRVPTPPDSYLQYKVYSVDQLIEQVSDNPTVRGRFARHFHIPEDRVVSYMRANLVESYIPRTGRYIVYCVRKSGKFYPVRQTFRRGTKVFALRNGQPVMKWVCGNPLSRFLPSVQVRTITERPPAVTKVSPSLQELVPADTQDILVPAEVPVPVYQPLVPVSLVSAATPLLRGGGGSVLPFLLPVALVGVHGGGGGNGVPVLVPIPGTAVPEPGTGAYLALGLPLALLALRRRHRPGKAGQARS